MGNPPSSHWVVLSVSINKAEFESRSMVTNTVDLTFNHFTSSLSTQQMWQGEQARKDEGRPMVWETHKVCKEASHSWFASLYLPSPLTTNIENTLGHAATSTSLACKNEPEVGLRRFDSVHTSSASLASENEQKVCLYGILTQYQHYLLISKMC